MCFLVQLFNQDPFDLIQFDLLHSYISHGLSVLDLLASQLLVLASLSSSFVI